jgi:DnaD/phage-associated family protein
MPNRILKETICTSDTLAAISAEAERLWWRIVAQADDFGRFDARPETIRGQCLTAMINKVTSDHVVGWLTELQESGLLHLYQTDGKPYLQITTWDKHQHRRSRFSKFPAPPAGTCDALREHPLPAERDIEALLVDGLRNRGRIGDAEIASVERQVRVGSSYLDIVVKCTTPSGDARSYVLEVKRGRLSNAATEQLAGYLEQVPAQGVLIGCGLAANFNLDRCRQLGLVVLSYDDELCWTVVLAPDTFDLGWIPGRRVITRELTADDVSHRENTLPHVMRIFEESRNEDRGIEESSSRSRDAVNETTTTAGFSDLVTFWQSNGFGLMPPLTAEKIHAYLDDGLPADLIQWAMEQAVIAGVDKLNFRYVDGILRRLVTEGITSRAAAAAAALAKAIKPKEPAYRPREVWK